MKDDNEDSSLEGGIILKDRFEEKRCFKWELEKLHRIREESKDVTDLCKDTIRLENKSTKIQEYF